MYSYQVHQRWPFFEFRAERFDKENEGIQFTLDHNTPSYTRTDYIFYL